MGKSACVLSLVAVIILPAMATIDRWGYTSYLWQPTGEGPHYYNNAANWEDGHQPVTFEGAYFGSGTVTIPAATADNPYTDGAGLFPYLSLLDRGGKFTIDASNTYWLKKYDSTDTDHGYSFLAELSGGYFYGVEGLHYRPGNNAAEFLATNMVMEFSRAAADEDDGATMTLRQGYFNYYDPPGAEGLTFGPSMKFFNSGYGANRVVYEEGTHTRVRHLEYRGNSPDTLFWIKGGLHENFGNFDFKSQNNGNPGRMRISGGVYDQVAGALTFPTATRGVNDDWTVSAYLTIDGTGALYATNTTTQIAKSGNGGIGVLSLSDYGEAHLRQVWMNFAQGAIGRVEMSGNSFMDQISRGETFAIGMEKDSVGVFSMTDNARAELGNMRLGAWDNNSSRPHGYGELNLSGNAYLSVAEISAGRSLNSTGIVEIAGNAVMTTQGSNIFLGNDNSETYGRISVSGNGGLEHGHIYVANNWNTDADLIFSGSATNHVWQDNNGYVLFLGKTSNSVGRAYFKDNSRTVWGQVRIAADDNNGARAHDTAKGEMYIMDNASVKVNNQLLIGRAWNTEGLLDISGGVLDMGSSQLTASETSNSFARIHMTGGRLQTAGNIVFDSGEYSTGSYYFGGNAQVEQTGGTTFIANGNHTDTTVTIGDNAYVKWNIWLGGQNRTHANGTIIVTNNATMALTGSWFGLALDSTNRIVVTDHAKMKFVGDLRMGWSDSAESVNEIIVEQSGGLEGPDSGAKVLQIGGENYVKRSASRVLLRGGESQADTLDINLQSSTNALLEVSGGNHVFHHLYIYDQHVGVDTNTVRVTGGRVRFNDWTVIGNGNEHGRLEVGGGTFSTREINLGFANTPAGMMSTMVVTGGVVEVENGANDAWFQLGNGAGNASRGRLEQTGGEIRVHSIRANHSASGRSDAFFDGGKVVQSVKVHNEYGIIQGLTQAELGTTGLTIDSNGFASYIKQEFTDADDGNGGTVDGKVTKTGEGSLDVRLNSDHAVTVVEQGTLSFSNGADHFGRKLVLAAGASVKVEEGHPIRVDEVETLGTCYIDVDFISGNGSYQIFDSSTLDPSKMTGLRLRVSDPYKSYTWGADGTFTVADRTFTDAEWTGEASSVWNTAGNWDPATVPGAGSRALFGAVQNRSVTVASGDETDIAEFTASGYTLSGSDALKVNSAVVNNSEGTVTFSAPVEFGAAAAIDGTAGGETVFSGGIAGSGASVAKTGSSKALIGGTGEDFTGSWLASGGTLGFTRSGAFGTFSELAVGLATVDYSAGNNAAAAGKLVVNTGVAKRGAIIDVSTAGSQLTFNNVRLDSGSFVKKGAGMLKFDLGAGEFNFGDTSDRWDNPNVNIAFEARGDSPASTDMFNNFSVVEGRMVIEGDGSNVTKVVHRNGLAVGERYAGKVAEAELVLKNVYFDNFVDAYFSIGRVSLSTTFNEPNVQVIDGTYLHTQKLVVGWGSAVQTLSTLAVTNSVVYCNDHIKLAENDNSTAKVRVGPGGKIRARNNIDIRGGLDVLVEGAGAEMTAENSNGHDNHWTWDGILRFEDWRGQGTMAFKNGGTLSLASRIHCYNKYTDGSAARPGVQLVFDGGTLKLGSNGTSIMWKPQYQGVKTEGAGMTLSVAEGAVSTWTIPIRGDGGLVKTGAGELNFAGVKDCTDYRNVNNVFEFDFTDTDMLNGWYEGATEVREGTLTLAAGSITNTTDVTVGEAGTLNLGGNSFEFPSVAGAGVISNGTLTAKILVAVNGNTDEGTTPVFSGVTLPANQRFDLSFTEGELEYNQAYTLSMGGFAADGMAGWTAWVDGKRKRAEFSVDGSGHTVITVRHDHGTMLFIR